MTTNRFSSKRDLTANVGTGGGGHQPLRWCDAGRHSAAKVERWQRVLWRCATCRGEKPV